jgi:hypothetical protein
MIDAQEEVECRDLQILNTDLSAISNHIILNLGIANIRIEVYHNAKERTRVHRCQSPA